MSNLVNETAVGRRTSRSCCHLVGGGGLLALAAATLGLLLLRLATALGAWKILTNQKTLYSILGDSTKSKNIIFENVRFLRPLRALRAERRRRRLGAMLLLMSCESGLPSGRLEFLLMMPPGPRHGCGKVMN